MLKWLIALFRLERLMIQETPREPVPEKVVKLADKAKRKRGKTTQDAE